jgi:hypothetical protein
MASHRFHRRAPITTQAQPSADTAFDCIVNMPNDQYNLSEGG